MEKTLQSVREEKLKEKARKVSIIEGSVYSVMDGFGLRYIAPYAIALGVSNFFIALLNSVPQLLASLAHIPALRLLGKYTRKKIVISAVIFQTLMWLPIILLGIITLFREIQIFYLSILLIIFYTMLIMATAIAAPAWTSWMRDLIDKNVDSYFARRNTIAGAVGLISTFIAGNILNLFDTNNILFGFSIIFSIALIGRGTCAYLFKKKHEPEYRQEKEYYFSFYDFLKRMSHNNFGRFVIFQILINFAVAIAAPFFSVYMLKNLNFSYGSYTLVISANIITTLVSLPFWGKFGDKFGNVKILRMAGAFIFLVPLLWLLIPMIKNDLGDNSILFYIILVEIFSGFIWAGLNLASGLFVYTSVTPQRIALCYAYSTVLISFGAFIGASFGGLLASKERNILGLEPILFIFALSGILRLIIFALFVPAIKEVKEVENFYLNKEIKKLAKKITQMPTALTHYILTPLKNFKNDF